MMSSDVKLENSKYKIYAYYPEKFKKVLELDQINEHQFLESLNSN